ncbi:PRD domain-containing protein [Thorsellia anophelis]|nr:PRD domain-containing protein [Thorsellia anophelis]
MTLITKKILNNSLVLCSDDKGQEVIIMAKGLGFKSKVGDIILPELAEKLFVLQNDIKTTDYEALLDKVSSEVIELVSMILEESTEELGISLNEKIFFSLVDHVHFAIWRYHQGIIIQNNQLNDIKKFYPKEYAIAKIVIDKANDKFNLQLPDEEAGNIAFHLVSHQLEVQDIQPVMLATKLLKTINRLVLYHLHIEIESSSWNHTCFLTHMRFFIQRIMENKQLHSNDPALLALIQQSYPHLMICGNSIKQYIESQLNTQLTDEEFGYLLIHLVRLTSS